MAKEGHNPEPYHLHRENLTMTMSIDTFLKQQVELTGLAILNDEDTNSLIRYRSTHHVEGQEAVLMLSALRDRAEKAAAAADALAARIDAIMKLNHV